MKVFISEYVCGGGWSDPELPPSLEREGLAMLRAVVCDFAQIPDCQVVTTLDHRRPDLDINSVSVIRVSSPLEEQRVFLELALDSDVCLVIAPELGNVLHQRCLAARDAGVAHVLNPDSETIHLCSDKLRLAQFLQSKGVPTIETSRLGHDCSLSAGDGPVVVKPRFGAGSQDVHTFPNLKAAMELRSWQPCEEINEIIVQPFVSGTAVSVGVICQPHTNTWEILPTGTQSLSTDGTFAYEGGRIPWAGTPQSAVRQTVDSVCSKMSGLAGYLGFDLIMPHDEPQQPVIVEINPRLTTSYLGYRRLTHVNLASRMLDGAAVTEPIHWNPGHVEFTPAGAVVCSTGSSTGFELQSEVVQ